ncbi:hypothetical protein TYM08_P0173 [Marinicellulosiphila megalodicopiae]
MLEFRTEQLNQELLQNLHEEFHENLADAENLIIELEHQPKETEKLSALFRNIHTVKGNLSIAQLPPLIPVLQELEDVLSLVRQGELEFNPKIGDLSLLLLDHVKTFLNDSLESETVFYDAKLYEDVGIQINKISTHSDPELQILKALALLNHNQPSLIEIEESMLHNQFPEQYPDLTYFANLIPSVENRMPQWKGRTNRLLNLAHRMLDGSQYDFDFEQIAAAIYTHDIAMSFLPIKLLSREQPMTQNEKKQIKAHVYACSFLLSQSEHWQQASRILHEHHEWVNGLGYPKGLTENDIHPGAMCLSIIHAYEAITHGHYYKSDYQRPVKRALVELSKLSNQQFSAFWVERLITSLYIH